MTDINKLKVWAEALAIRAGSAGPDISADVLGLIEEVEKLRADTSSMRGSLNANSKCTKKLIKDGTRAAKERDRLRAENEALLLGMRAILNAYDYADQHNKEGVAVEVMEDLRTLFKAAAEIGKSMTQPGATSSP